MRSARSLSLTILALCVALLYGCAGTGDRTRGGPGSLAMMPRAQTQVGLASYYAEKHHGCRTACGEKFDMSAMTAAHPTLPFGTKVRVTNLLNGRSVVVRVNDRGPFARGRIIDVSRRAARELQFLGRGTARVRIDVVS